MARCPTCRNDAKPRADNPAFPFCSERCKAIDLGKWFTGAYRVPGRSALPDDRADGPTDPEDEAPREGRGGRAGQ